MSKFPGVPDRINARLRALGYWKNGKPDVRRFSQERGYRWQYVYEWIRGRVPGPENLGRLATDLAVSEAWLLLGGADEAAEIEQVATAGGLASGARSAAASRSLPTKPLETAAEPGRAVKPEHPSEEAIATGPRASGRVVDLVQPLTRLRELTEHLVEAEQALRESQERFQIMADSAPVMIWMSDPDTLCSFFNKPWLEFTGRSLEQNLGNGWAESVHPEDTPRCLQTYLDAFHAHRLFTMEYRMRRADGEYRWILDTGVPRFEADGGFAGYIGSGVDITERRRAEETTRAFVEVGRRLTESLDAVETVRRIATTARDVFKVRRAAVVRIDPVTGVLDFLAVDGEPPADGDIAQSGLGVLAIAGGATVWSADVLADPRLSHEDAVREAIRAEDLRAGAAAPLLRQGHVLGVLVLRDVTGRSFSETDLDLLGALAAHAAVGLENARLYAESEQSRREAVALAEVAKRLTETLDVREVGQRVVDAVLPLLNGWASNIRLLLEDGFLETIAGTGEWLRVFGIGHRLPPDTGLSGRAVATGHAVWTHDVLSDPTLLTEEDARRLEAAGSVAMLAVPLRVNGRTIGTIMVSRPRGHSFDDNDIRLAQAFADQAALAVHNARLHEETERRRREAEVLADITGAINSSLDLDTVLDRVTEAARQICNGQGVAIALREPETNRMAVQFWVGALTKLSSTIDPTLGLGGVALRTGRPARTASYVDDPRVPPELAERARAQGITAAMVATIRIGSEVEGLLYVTSHSARTFSDRDEEALVRLAEHAAVAIGNARLHAAAQERLRETETLLAVSWAVGSTADPTEALRRVARETAQALGADTVAAYLADPDGSYLRPIAGYRVPRSRLDRFRRLPFRLQAHPFLDQALKEKRPAVSESVSQDHRIGQEAKEGLPDYSLLFLPMVVKDESIGGLFVVWWNTGRTFKLGELRLAEAVSRQAALALDNARLLRETERLRAVTDNLAAVGRLVARSADPAEVAQLAADSLRRLLGAPWCDLFRLDRRSGDLVCVACSGDVGSGFGVGVTVRSGMGVVGFAVEGRSPVVTHDLLADARIQVDADLRARVEATPFRSALALPLIVKDEVVGVLAVGDEPGRTFHPEDVHVAGAFADQVAVALDKARLFPKGEHGRED